MSIQDYYGGAAEELDIGHFAYCELTPMDEGEQSDSVASDPSQDIWQPGEVSLLKQLFEFFKDKGPKAYRNITAELKKHKFYFNPSQVEQKLRQLGLHVSSVETSHVGIRGRNFSEVEDTQICRSWKTITNDATVGTDQARTKFWEKIQIHAARHQPSLATRPPDALRQRFSHLKKLVQKYHDCEVFAFRHQGSGTSYEDVLSTASKNFMVQTTSRSSDCKAASRFYVTNQNLTRTLQKVLTLASNQYRTSSSLQQLQRWNIANQLLQRAPKTGPWAKKPANFQ
ncbi:uncharacterized protein LOC129746829 [Uranotaenia lowii]|uniref:uncharacterized protein LOC129746829 n=1 Tax=Uranotaenia lowii TaxID=190385 RepID=UPI00247A69FB|nr:uncharacterized protein LOC129746829 [Uranotaenia lowii]